MFSRDLKKCVTQDENLCIRIVRFDKFAGSDFERAKRDPKGESQYETSNPAGRAKLAVTISSLVGIAQLVEPRIVIPVVEGSSPFTHPKPEG